MPVAAKQRLMEPMVRTGTAGSADAFCGLNPAGMMQSMEDLGNSEEWEASPVISNEARWCAMPDAVEACEASVARLGFYFWCCCT